VECLVTFLLLMVVFLFVTGAFARAHSVRARRRFIYEQLARRYAGAYVPAGLWRPGVRLRYGDTRATLRETARGKPFANRCTQLVIDWPDPVVRCEVVPRALAGLPTTLYFLREFPTGDAHFDQRYAVRGIDEKEVRSLIREGVRWQLERLASVPPEGTVYVVVQQGQITVRKPRVFSRLEELRAFVERALELYDQLMLTRVSGIDFLAEDEAQPLGEVICPVCGEPVVRDMVFCRRCKTPHHADCWQFVSCCAVYGCGEKHCQTPQPAQSPAPPPE